MNTARMVDIVNAYRNSVVISEADKVPRTLWRDQNVRVDWIQKAVSCVRLLYPH